MSFIFDICAINTQYESSDWPKIWHKITTISTYCKITRQFQLLHSFARCCVIGTVKSLLWDNLRVPNNPYLLCDEAMFEIWKDTAAKCALKGKSDVHFARDRRRRGHSTVSLPSITGQFWQLKGILIFNYFIVLDSFAIYDKLALRRII